MRRGLSALLLAICCGAGCASSQKTSMEALQTSVESYNEAFRWKNYERAASYVPPDVRTTFLATYEDDDNSLQVDDYSIVKVDFENETSATVTVRLRYMQLPSNTVEKTTLVQHWKRIDGTWILETEDNALRVLEVPKAPKPSENSFGPPGDGDSDPETPAPQPREDVDRGSD